MPSLIHPVPAIVGFGHLARAGKDTAAGILVAEFGYQHLAFADNVRAVVYEIDPDVARLVDDLGWESAKESCPVVRVALQRVGVGLRTVLGDNIWVDAAMNAIIPGRPVVISDVRFPNEAERIISAGGVVFRIDRPGVVPANNHITETALSEWTGWTAIISNDGSLDDLKDRVLDAIGRASYADGVRNLQPPVAQIA